jgi:hypothetical protein
MRARIFGGLLSVSLLAAVGAGNLQTQREWPVYGGSPEDTCYSSLKQITPANVKQLDVAGTCDTGYVPIAMTCDAVSYIDSAATISAGRQRARYLDAIGSRRKQPYREGALGAGPCLTCFIRRQTDRLGIGQQQEELVLPVL